MDTPKTLTIKLQKVSTNEKFQKKSQNSITLYPFIFTFYDMNFPENLEFFTGRALFVVFDPHIGRELHHEIFLSRTCNSYT